MLNKKRQVGIDVVKIVAAMLVITVHHFNTIGFYEVKYSNGKTMLFATALYLIALSCVPIFLIVSGYLLRNREISKSHFKKIVYFLVEVFLIYLLGTAVVMITKGDISILQWVKNSIKKFLDPSYYVGLYFSLYLMAPFINKLFNSMNDAERKYFLVVVILTISLPSTLNLIPKVGFFDTRFTGVWSVMYYIIGLYIREYHPKLKAYQSIFLIGFVSLLYGVLLNYFLSGQEYRHFFGYYQNIFVAVVASLIVVSLYRIQSNRKSLTTVLKVLSSSTMTFYLFSGMFSDGRAMMHITLSGTLYKDLITIVPKVLYSMFYSIPLAVIVCFLMSFINKKLSRLEMLWIGYAK